MAKSIRSKVKKRLRSVKRSVIKKQRLDPSSKLGEGGAKTQELLNEAATGHIRPPKKVKNAFRYDDEEAVIPQHNWRQGPDFRSDRVGFEAGYAVWGTNRPKLGRFGGDAPSARVDPPVSDPRQDGVAARLLRETEQIVPLMATKKQKKRLKLKAKSGTDHNVFRWT